jgi:hypothetical protein
MKLKGVKTPSLADAIAQLIAKGAWAKDAACGDAAQPATSRFQSALAKRISAASVLWGASDVLDFEVGDAVVDVRARVTPWTVAANLRLQ